MKRVLIMTVGTGTRKDVDIAKPLVKSIRNSRPDLTYLIVTEKSEVHGRRICKEMEWPDADGPFRMKRLEDSDNFEKVFLFVNDTIREVISGGFSAADIEVDFTSGTKAMSAGALLAAVFNRCGTAKYIAGERRDGVVIGGTEAFHSISPSRVFALHDIRLAKEMILKLRYAAAESILAKLKREGLGEVSSVPMVMLTSIVQGYSAWEMFDHKTALNKLKDTVRDDSVAPFAPRAEALEMLERISKKSREPDADMLVDLFNNAARRGFEGKYDDAVARLYRLTELFAQYALLRDFHIDTGDVDLRKLPEKLWDGLEKQRDSKDGKIRIGLHRSYETLDHLGHPVGRRYAAETSLQGRLRERNSSILAHGLHPVSKAVYESLCADVSRLISSEVSDFEDRCNKVQFPWLRSVL